MAVPSPPRSRPARRTISRPSIARALGVILAVSAIAAWSVVGVPAAWETWSAAIQTPSAAQVPYDEQRASLEGYDLYRLLLAARDQCPPGKNILALTDDIRADQQGHYVLYPRRLDVVRPAQPFGAGDLKAHAGGCAFFYGDDVYNLFAPYQALLAKEIACVEHGCLYLVAPDGGSP